MSTPISSTHRFRKPRIILALFSLILCASLVTAAVFVMFYTNNTATVRATDVQLGAGPDATGGTVYPNASVTVASTFDFATVGFSMFPSAANNPQPATYYTNLLNISNAGSSSHTIKSIKINNIVDDSTSLGNITIYYYATQTDTPETDTPISAASITSTTPVTLFSGNQTIAAGATQYFEILAYAAEGATAGNTVTFRISIEWV